MPINNRMSGSASPKESFTGASTETGCEPLCVLTKYCGSSSIRFAEYEAGGTPQRRLEGKIDRIGLKGTNLIVNDPGGNHRSLAASLPLDHGTAAGFLLDCLDAQPIFASVKAARHDSVK